MTKRSTAATVIAVSGNTWLSRILSTTASGELVDYGNVGWFAAGMTLIAIWLSPYLKAVS